ncbi:MAG: AbrB/MazE/SpoVT family DNA-binding domain-containing protein [Candidatus Diapherotrites archaeon]|nr:AbrB/MazE/SpoVT family DNA-binding domain-containing protein [Candidatus Diapherotrites archaeon]
MKVGPKGQVLIPKTLRKTYQIGPFDRVVLEGQEKGILITKPPEIDAVKIFHQIALSGKNYDYEPHFYEKELEERWKKAQKK